MSTNNLYRQLHEHIEEWLKNSEREIKELDKDNKVYPELSNIYNHLAISQIHTKFIYTLLKHIVTSVENIDSLLEKLPKTAEFEEISKEVKNVKELANSTLVPMQEEREELKKLQERGSNIYG
jgi:hypothetical protein